ncbi:hypothetical protein [Micromonospora echinofusca]|uniref:Immunity protein 8 n=1 Tax=Micromonospora echinofusca TaxID=47858 RepID=A0ABS3VQ63_MICEH|nr:hypothetical protein [Micromonospora echinofusca]MBO4206686.1 hypothetical protein [Micromonospora echinofusca]
MDLVVRFGLVTGERDTRVVVPALEEALSVFFEPNRTPDTYSAYVEPEDVSLSLRFDWPVESAFEQACPHVMSVETGKRHNIPALGRVFGQIAASGRFRAAMLIDWEEIAITRGVPEQDG